MLFTCCVGTTRLNACSQWLSTRAWGYLYITTTASRNILSKMHNSNQTKLSKCILPSCLSLGSPSPRCQSPPPPSLGPKADYPPPGIGPEPGVSCIRPTAPRPSPKPALNAAPKRRGSNPDPPGMRKNTVQSCSRQTFSHNHLWALALLEDRQTIGLRHLRIKLRSDHAAYLKTWLA